MNIGNIVCDTDLVTPNGFNLFKNIDEIKNQLPTIIVGYDVVNKLFPNIDTLNRKIRDNLFWTFRKKEMRDLNAEDIHNFINFSFKFLIKDIKYKFIDPIQYTKTEIDKIFDFIKSEQKIISYCHNNMIYIYCGNNVFGIDLKLYTYMGFNADKIINKINLLSTVFLVENDIIIEYKEYIERLNYEVKYIPYLYSINEQNSTISNIHFKR